MCVIIIQQTVWQTDHWHADEVISLLSAAFFVFHMIYDLFCQEEKKITRNINL